MSGREIECGRTWEVGKGCRPMEEERFDGTRASMLVGRSIWRRSVTSRNFGKSKSAEE